MPKGEGMAGTSRHAAGRSLYEVHEILAGEPALDLGSRYSCSDYLEAFDFALDFLQEHDPERVGRISGLDIKQVQGVQQETVWAYRHGDPGEVQPDLVARWGFDVNRWTGPTGLRL
jgi:hypothetical protein